MYLSLHPFGLNREVLDPAGQFQNSYNSELAVYTADHQISQHLSVEKGEREGTESDSPNGVLQTSVQGEQGEGEMG